MECRGAVNALLVIAQSAARCAAAQLGLDVCITQSDPNRSWGPGIRSPAHEI